MKNVVNNRYVKKSLICLIVLGIGLAVVGYRNSMITAHEAVPSAEMSSAPPPPQIKPTFIPPGKPVSISVKTRSKTIIDHAPMDQNFLAEGPNGVIPGDKPGLFVKDTISTLPSSFQDGTVIIGGHAYAQSPMVFNPLSDLNNINIGNSLVVLEMPAGELRYVVEAILIVNKIDLPMQHALADNRPGRIELISCDVRGSNDSFQNRIIVACDEQHPGCSTLV